MTTDHPTVNHPSKNILVCGVNWLGDGIMSMPALQAFREREPACRITLLLKPHLSALWGMQSDVDTIMPLETGVRGTLRTSLRVRQCVFDRAYVFPNSIRSALIPWLAHIPFRAGVPNRERGWLLSQPVTLRAGHESLHQAWEYMDILGDPADELPPPRLTIPDAVVAAQRERLGGDAGGAWVGLVPGAAYGPAKRWPMDHFVAVGQRLSEERGCRPVVLGTAGEAKLCAEVARGIGDAAVSLAGLTSLPELAAVFSLCRTVVTNDSGGMHLAAAAGTRVVAVYGITDPTKTGPLGPGHKVICLEGVERSRDIARDSQRARDALCAITPERVLEALQDILDG